MWSSQVLLLSLQNLQRQYQSGAARPEDIVRLIYDRINAAGDDHVWIYLVPEEAALKRARELGAWSPDRPLFGIPFAVKDNIDVEGLPTTAGCPAFSYVPQRTASAVQKAVDAGAILIGKTNMDQFATGLVGTRSPYGACSSIYHSRLHFGRLQFRFSARGRERRSLFRSGHRYRGIGPHTGGL